MTKTEIFERIVHILGEAFDVDTKMVTPQARLYDDLGIDSIDAVDLIVQLRPLIGKRLQPDAFKSVRTVQDVVDAMYHVMEPSAHA